MPVVGWWCQTFCPLAELVGIQVFRDFVVFPSQVGSTMVVAWSHVFQARAQAQQTTFLRYTSAPRDANTPHLSILGLGCCNSAPSVPAA